VLGRRALKLLAGTPLPAHWWYPSPTPAPARAAPEQPNALETPELLRVEPAEFIAHQVTRATGPLQITHGDVARSVGYCNAVPYYQQPQARWQKADEDRMFRWLLGTPGLAVDIDGVCRVQHVQKGRYADTGSVTSLRRRFSTTPATSCECSITMPLGQSSSGACAKK